MLIRAELEIGRVWHREKFVYDLRFLGPPLAKRPPLQLRISPYGRVENTTVGSQPLTHSESLQACPRPASLSHRLSPPSGWASEDPCSFPTARRGHGNPSSHPSPRLSLSSCCCSARAQLALLFCVLRVQVPRPPRLEVLEPLPNPTGPSGRICPAISFFLSF